MAHVELREVHDDDLDAVFEMMRDREAVARAAFTAADPDDRAAFDEWMLRQRSSEDVELFVVTESGGFAGTAALFSADGDREVTYWVARHAWGRGGGHPGTAPARVARAGETSLCTRRLG